MKNDGELVARSRVVYLRLKYVNRVFCNEIFGRAGDFAKTSRKSI